ncbi:MAG: MBL fold metallo-hydrolase, partial [Candidatus Micrarchaeota archaeon]|nr:MBL fold metallo-hydrolase [Candidatus Micrarchaeota archaeon]
MTTLTFYGGANEIGGNKILLQDKDARVYLDFGQSFDFGEKYFYEYLQPRAAHGLEVYFEFGLVPKVPKLYSKTMLERTDLKYQAPDVDGVLITHSHSDHVNHLPFLDESIPVHMGHGTHRILETYHTLYPNFVNIGEHSAINHFKSGDSFNIKHLEVQPVHVEHSIPGA